MDQEVAMEVRFPRENFSTYVARELGVRLRLVFLLRNLGRGAWSMVELVVPGEQGGVRKVLEADGTPETL